MHLKETVLKSCHFYFLKLLSFEKITDENVIFVKSKIFRKILNKVSLGAESKTITLNCIIMSRENPIWNELISSC